MAKPQTTDFVISQDQTTILKENVDRVRSHFGVEVSLTLNPNNGIQWICLEGSTKELRDVAKTYITSLCSTESKRCVDLELKPGVFEDLKNGNGGKEIEKLSGAVLSFHDSKVFLQGDDLVVTVALSEIERRNATFGNQNELHASCAKGEESDDGLEHDAENIPERSIVDATDIPPSMREFARKLLYQDKEIDAVVRTFGTEIDINKLLQELVKNSASTLQLSSASEEINLPPIARGSCASPLQASNVRILHPRGAVPALTARRREFYEQPEQHVNPFGTDNLRPIVIDGSNVAMNHGNQQVFSCRGIKLCVGYFLRRGHTDITVFVPMWRREEPWPESPIKEREVLEELALQNILKFTPSRWRGNRHTVCYDDKYVVELADENGGIIVSNDNFRDLQKENPRWKETIEQRTLGYTFVGDRFMPPDDPLGRRGPSLDDFLRKGSATHPKICPYLKNCTFGNRCKYYHPERATQRQQELTPVRNSPENSEPPATSSVEAAVNTTTNQSTRNHSRNTVGDPRVSPQPHALQPSPMTSANGNHQRTIVSDPKVSLPSFKSYFENHCRPQDVTARGSGHAAGAPYNQPHVPHGSGQRYPAYYGGNVYCDYSRPIVPDYTAGNPQYQEPAPVYQPDMSQFSALPPVQLPPYAHHPFAPPAGMAYPAGQCTYQRTYFEPAPTSYRNFQGLRPQKDQIDSGNQQESCNSGEFDSLVKELKTIFKSEIDEEAMINVLLCHPQECANGDINKLAAILLDQN